MLKWPVCFRYTGSLLWLRSPSFQSFSGEMTITSDKLWVVGPHSRLYPLLTLNVTCPSALKNFISYRRYETMSLHGIMQGLSTTGCKWTTSSNSSSFHTSASESLKRRELLEEFVVWYFGSFVAPLLRASLPITSGLFFSNWYLQTTFYITESSAFKNKILYFRQDDWDVLCAPLIERLTSVTFSKLEEVCLIDFYVSKF